MKKKNISSSKKKSKRVQFTLLPDTVNENPNENISPPLIDTNEEETIVRQTNSEKSSNRRTRPARQSQKKKFILVEGDVPTVPTGGVNMPPQRGDTIIQTQQPNQHTMNNQAQFVQQNPQQMMNQPYIPQQMNRPQIPQQIQFVNPFRQSTNPTQQMRQAQQMQQPMQIEQQQQMQQQPKQMQQMQQPMQMQQMQQPMQQQPMQQQPMQQMLQQQIQQPMQQIQQPMQQQQIQQPMQQQQKQQQIPMQIQQPMEPGEHQMNQIQAIQQQNLNEFELDQHHTLSEAILHMTKEEYIASFEEYYERWIGRISTIDDPLAQFNVALEFFSNRTIVPPQQPENGYVTAIAKLKLYLLYLMQHDDDMMFLEDESKLYYKKIDQLMRIASS